MPVKVTKRDDWIEISGGVSHSLAVAKSGTLWVWGDNSSGQLGDGTVINRPSPVQLTGISNITALAAGDAG